MIDLHPTLREAPALHEGFRRLHFTSDEIYLRPTGTQIHVTVRRNGLEFNALAGLHDMSEVDLVKRWTEASDWWNTKATDAEQQEIYRGSRVVADSASFVMALLAKGFNVRKVDA